MKHQYSHIRLDRVLFSLALSLVFLFFVPETHAKSLRIAMQWNAENNELRLGSWGTIVFESNAGFQPYGDWFQDEFHRKRIEARIEEEQKNGRACMVLIDREGKEFYTLTHPRELDTKSMPHFVTIDYLHDYSRDENVKEISTFRFPEIRVKTYGEQQRARMKSFGTAGLKTVNGHKGSYMFLALVDPQTNFGYVSGWLTAKEASGIVFSGLNEQGVFFVPESQYGKKRISVENRDKSLVQSETFIIGVFDDCRDGLEQYADEVAKAASVKLKPLPSGYCTWYSNKYGGACDEIHIQELAQDAKTKLGDYGFDFIQIDDKWQLGKKTNGPKKNFTNHDPKGPYPKGMKATAELLTAQGFTPGIWFMPFAGNVDDPHFPKHWYVKSGRTDSVNESGKSDRKFGNIINREGEPYESHWGGTSLDMTNPEVRTYLEGVTRRICSEWGYTYLKLDGLWTGLACDQLYVNNEYLPDDLGEAVFHDPAFTPVAAYREGFEAIRRAAPEVFILGCNVSQNMRMMHPSIGYCDAMRIGPDNGSSWGSLKRGPWHGTNRYFFNGRTWWNDPDPVYLRNSMPLEHARLIASWVAVSGQLYAFSEWLPELGEDRLEILRKTIPAHALKSARPVDLFSEDLAKVWTLTDSQENPSRFVVALYNWDEKKATTIETSAKTLGLPDSEKYHAYDYWEEKLLDPLTADFRFEVPAGSCRVLAIQPENERPVLLSTSRHVTQGILEIRDEKWDSVTKTLSGTSVNVPPGRYELRFLMPEKSGFETVTPTSPEIVSQKRQGRLLQLEFELKEQKTISWSVKFE